MVQQNFDCTGTIGISPLLNKKTPYSLTKYVPARRFLVEKTRITLKNSGSRARILDRILLSIMVIAPFSLVVVRWPYLLSGIFLLILILVHFYRTRPVFFARSLFWPLFYVAMVTRIPWPANFIAPLVLYLALYWTWPRLRQNTGWLVRGTFTRSAVSWMVPTILISSGSLIGWAFLLHPDFSDLVPMIPAGGVAMLIGIGLLFSIGNAVWEEFILKGLLWNSLEMVFSNIWKINLTQAILFGLIHFHGFPRGWIGVAMAGGYGYVIGIIRSKSHGLFAPIVTHIFADATIFVVLYFLSVGAFPVR
jgi:membrane protease YdiL (CAAX protease family)